MQGTKINIFCLVHGHLEKGKDGTEKMEMFRKRPGEKNVQKDV